MHSNLNAGIVNNTIRSVMTLIIDRPAFFLLKILYIVFISVAETELFNDSTIRHVYYKIQLILGIFMIFKLSVSVLEAIVNPDKLTAKKTGTMSIIARIFISLALLAALTPINIPNPKNDYEKKLKNNGLIFGVLYSLQSRILGQDTLGRLILGNELTVSSGKSDELKKQRNSYLTNAANSFTSTVLKTFMRINLVSEKDRVQNTTGEPDEANSQNWVCQNIDSNILDTYNDASSDPQEILDYINEDCSSGLKSKYVFAYLPLGGIAAYVFAFLLLTFTIDVAIRAIKIAILRLIAPIPVISYMSPNPKDNGAMGTWAKALMTTYLELFTRLLIVYIVIYLIQRIIFDGLTISASYSGLITPIAYIMIFLGLFLFAKQAPKFIKDAIGMKGPGMSNIGLNAALSGLGSLRAGATAGDAFDAARESVDTDINAYNQGKAAPSIATSYNTGRDHAAKMLTGDDKMTWQAMHRGQNRLAREGITPENADALHSAATEASAFTERMEKDFSNGLIQYRDASGNLHSYKYKDANGNIRVVNDKHEMSLALDQQRALSSKLSSRDSKVDAEIKKHGANRSWKYKSRPNVKPQTTGRMGSINQDIADYTNIKYGDTNMADTPNVSQAGVDIKTHQ